MRALALLRLGLLIALLPTVSACGGCSDPSSPVTGTGGGDPGAGPGGAGGSGPGSGGTGAGGSGGAGGAGGSMASTGGGGAGFAGPDWQLEAILDLGAATPTSFWVSWQAPVDDVGVTAYRVYDGGVLVGEIDASTLSYEITGVAIGDYHEIKVEAGDADGNWTTDGPSVHGTAVPADPAPSAPPNDPAVPTSLFGSTAFLYTGASPVQTGVSAGTIQKQRAAVLRGRVITRAGAALPGVIVTVSGHPELGQTLSRSDGTWDLAVNGGGQITVTFDHPDHLRAYRTATPQWEDYHPMPDVALLRLDPVTTVVDMSGAAPLQIARGSEITDADGTRQAKVFLAAGTTAELVLPDGSTVPAPSLTLRLTEYTVGQDGDRAMPAELPCHSAYTYAVSLTADEARAIGARVKLSAPPRLFVTNFVGFPPGSSVPVGKLGGGSPAGTWGAAKNGWVFAMVSGGIDTDGDGVADNAGLSPDELAALDDEQEPDDELMDVPTEDLEIPEGWDLNWAQTIDVPSPEDSPPPEPEEEEEEEEPDEEEECESGCVLHVGSQSAAERIRVQGTPLWLHYESARMPGRRTKYRMSIPLTASAGNFNQLQLVRLQARVAGRNIVTDLMPAPDLVHAFEWDGLDVYGRTVHGRVPIDVRISFASAFSYAVPPDGEETFGMVGETAGPPGRETVRAVRTKAWRGSIGTIGAGGASLGGFGVSIHHVYDRTEGRLYMGDGSTRRAAALGKVIERVAGSGVAQPYNGVPVQALQANLWDPMDVATAPDGSYYVALSNDSRIVRVDPAGQLTLVAGNGNQGDGGDGGPAVDAELDHPSAVAVGPDGSVFIADNYNCRIRRVDPDGIIDNFAGTPGQCGSYPDPNGDGGPAAQATLGYVYDVDVGCDGSVYIADPEHHAVRRVGPEGTISTIAGGTDVGFSGDGGLAIQAQLNFPGALALGSDCNVYVADWYNHRIRRIDKTGLIQTIAGNGDYAHAGNPPIGEGGPAKQASFGQPVRLAVGPDGTVYASDEGTRRIVAIDGGGVLRRIAGKATPVPGPQGDGGGALAAEVWPRGIAVGPDGHAYFAQYASLPWSSPGVRRIRVAMPRLADTQQTVPSADGRELYVFDEDGRHLGTLDAFTQTQLWSFGYDAQGRLTSITDSEGNATTISRDATGVPTAIVAPHGQTTTLGLDVDGWLATVQNDAGETYTMTYGSGGLLSSLEDPLGNVHTFTYDADGRLTQAGTPAGGSKTLTRTKGESSVQIDVTTTLGRTTQYSYGRLQNGDFEHVRTKPSGVVEKTTWQRDATVVYQLADGSTVTQVLAPDPRWGALSPYAKSISVAAPGAGTLTATQSRTVTLSDPLDPLALLSHTHAVTSNGLTRTEVVDSAAKTITRTSGTGRQTIATWDSLGRIVSIDGGASFDPESFGYDAQGNVISRSRDGVDSTFGYDAQGRLQQVDVEAAAFLTLGHDAADRLSSLTVVGGGTTGLAYDALDRMTEVVMPAGAIATLGWDAADNDVLFMPAGGASSFVTTYDVDSLPVQRTNPSGRTVTFQIDAAGRVAGMTFPEATLAATWAPGSANVSALVRTPSTGSPQSSSYAYAGGLATSETLAGAANGTLSHAYDSWLRPSSRTLQSGADSSTVTIGWDGDGRITSLGPFTFSRAGSKKLTTTISGAGLVVDHTFAASRRLATRVASAGPGAFYSLAVTHSPDLRVVQRVETAAGVTTTFDIGRDVEGRVTQVQRDGAPSEAYGWDADGNRTSRQVGAGPLQTATYDGQGRLTSFAGVPWVFDADGNLAQRGTDTFVYDTRGSLVAATVGGVQVTYAYDALGRRTFRSSPTGTTEIFYGDLDRPLRPTHVRGEDGILSTLFYDDAGIVFAIERQGSWWFIGADYVGSPRVVVDQAGNVVERIDRDAFGFTLLDTNPGFFLPVGYAGGLVDPVTGFVRLGLRDYDPATGRFTTRDPVRFSGGQANLWALVNGDPVTFVDPTGLGSIGGSFYDVLGGGFKVSWNDQGVSVCVEAGIGFGTDFDLDLTSDTLDATGVTDKASISVSAGPLGLEASFSRQGDCPWGVDDVKASAGPFSYSGKDGGKFNAGKMGDAFKPLGFGMQGKVARQWCKQW